jgi:hypothetical protein
MKKILLISNVAKLVFFACIILIGYLFALNGRYMKLEDDVVLDKWKRCLYVEDSKELPFKYTKDSKAEEETIGASPGESKKVIPGW